MRKKSPGTFTIFLFLSLTTAKTECFCTSLYRDVHIDRHILSHLVPMEKQVGCSHHCMLGKIRVQLCTAACCGSDEVSRSSGQSLFLHSKNL